MSEESDLVKALELIKLLRDQVARGLGYSDSAEMDDYFDFEIDPEHRRLADSSKELDVKLDDY